MGPMGAPQKKVKNTGQTRSALVDFEGEIPGGIEDSDVSQLARHSIR
jgi:hypothetical protein